MHRDFPGTASARRPAAPGFSLVRRVAVALTVTIALVGGLLVLGSVPAMAAGGTIEGIVVDTANVRLGNVLVEVVNAGVSTTTNAQGEFSVSGLSGVHNLRFTPPEGSGLRTFLATGVDAETTPPLTVVLRPITVVRLEGVVADSKGTVYPHGYVEFQPLSGPSASVNADSNGRYSVELLAGQYSTVRLALSRESISSDVYISGESGPLSFDSSQTYDFVVPMSNLTVSVRDAGGSPVTNARLRLGTASPGITVAGGIRYRGFASGQRRLDANGDVTVSLATGITLSQTAIVLDSGLVIPLNLTQIGADRRVFVLFDRVTGTFIIDSTPPIVTGTTDRQPNGGGWYNAPVTVTWSSVDPSPSAGPPTTPPPTTVTTEGRDQVVTSEPSCDRAGLCATGTFTLSIDLTAPVVTLTGPTDGQTYPPDQVPPPACATEDALSGVAIEATPTVINNGNGSFTATCNGAVDIADNTVAPISVTYTVVNGSPVAVDDDSYRTTEDTALTVTTPGVLGNDTDPEANPLTAAVVTGPANGTLTLDPDGSFIYTPNANYAGTDAFTYTTTDATTVSNTATVTITVEPVNDTPVAVDDDYRTAEDTPLTVLTPGVLGNDTDSEGDPLTAALVTGPANGTLTLNLDGSFAYTPNANVASTDTFTYTASDATTVSNTATVTITVDPVNDIPVAVDDDYQTAEDTPLTVPAPGVLGNDTDPENDPLTATVVTGPADGALTLNPDGSFAYTPNANFTSTDTFTYTATDGVTTSPPATVTITVETVNDTPVAVDDDGYRTAEDTVLTVPVPGVLGNDTDPENDPLTATVVTGPANGTLILNPDGSFAYTPNANFAGTDTFTYTATDATTTSSPATVTITVEAVNDAPIAVDDAATTAEDTIVDIDVVANDTDVDNPNADLRAVSLSGVTGGTANLLPDGRTLRFTPAPDANTDNTPGGFSVTYRVNDGTLDSANTATTTITVTPVNDATITTLAVTPASPAASGTVETLTATVTPSVAGSVQFKDGTTAIGSPVPVTNGAASMTTTLASGTHSLTSVFTPTDTTAFNGSTSNTVSYVVNAPGTATTTTLRVIPNPVFQGFPVFLIANVAPSAAVGTVQFKDGTTALGAPVTVRGGTAFLNTSTLTKGTHTLTAVFTPTNPAAFAPSTSSPVSLTVNPLF